MGCGAGKSEENRERERERERGKEREKDRERGREREREAGRTEDVMDAGRHRQADRQMENSPGWQEHITERRLRI